MEIATNTATVFVGSWAVTYAGGGIPEAQIRRPQHRHKRKS
jgi:hypothetical protein